MTTDLNKTLEKDANGRLIDLYNIIQNEDITKAEGAKLKSLFETELRVMQLGLCQKVLNGESLS